MPVNGRARSRTSAARAGGAPLVYPRAGRATLSPPGMGRERGLFRGRRAAPRRRLITGDAIPITIDVWEMTQPKDLQMSTLSCHLYNECL